MKGNSYLKESCCIMLMRVPASNKEKENKLEHRLISIMDSFKKEWVSFKRECSFGMTEALSHVLVNCGSELSFPWFESDPQVNTWDLRSQRNYSLSKRTRPPARRFSSKRWIQRIFLFLLVVMLVLFHVIHTFII